MGLGLGLAVGALVSLFSFRLIVLTVVRLTERSTPRSRGQRYWWVRSILRLLGVALIVFLAIVYLPVNLIGMALGLLVVQLGMGGYFIVRSSLPDTNAASQEQK
ncbi:MAG: ATP synthase subunit I [Candidatus Methylomirabilis sp.]|nr:ATP synthase subunit I [Candidatus Methylomirabilis sp.]